MKAALNVLASMEGRKIAVLADMLELGEKEKDYHREVGTFLGQTSVNELYCVGPLSECIMEGAKEVNPDCKVQHFESNDDLASFLEGYLTAGDKVLIKGSNGMKLSEVIARIDGTAK